MASKAQRAAVRSRADKVNAAIGSFCKVKTILPLSLGLVEANPAPKVGEPFQIEVSTDPNAFTKPLSADPDLYMATMATETPIQRDMVLDMLHDLPTSKTLRVVIDTPRDWVARFIPGEGWEVAQAWDFGSALSWGYVNFGTTDDGENVIRASGVPLIAHLPEDTPEAEVFDRAEVIQRQNDDEEAMRRHDRMWANLESGHTVDGMNEYDLRETTQDVLDSLQDEDYDADPDDFCRKCGQFYGWRELNDNGHCLHCANDLRTDPADEPDDDYVMSADEAAYWKLVDKDNAERIYAEADAEDHKDMLAQMGMTEEDWQEWLKNAQDED